MKKFLALLGLAVAVVNPSFSSASEQAQILTVEDQVKLLLSSVAPYDLINWKVGDSAQYNVSIAPFGKIGSMSKAVTKDEGTAIWVTQNMDLMIQKQKVEMLINKADGQVLKTIVNGKEQQMPDDKIEIISQDYVDVTVPAGTFKAIHIVAKSKQASKIEVWANPRDTVMEGTVKQAINAQGMDIVMELTSFKRMP